MGGAAIVCVLSLWMKKRRGGRRREKRGKGKEEVGWACVGVGKKEIKKGRKDCWAGPGNQEKMKEKEKRGGK